MTPKQGATLEEFRKTQLERLKESGQHQVPTKTDIENFAQLALVAKAVIPDLRDMTAAEGVNLRQYYKKLYRKV